MKLLYKKEIPKRLCYDLTIRKNSNYFANGICIHNSNSGIVYNIKDDSFYYQSRERILSLTSDNAGFCLFAMSKEAVFRDIFGKLGKLADDVTTVCIYGEWAGQGIQKNVAVSKLPKMMIVFGIKLIKEDDTHEWVEFSHIDINYTEDNIYSVFLFPVHEVDIDFNYPALSQNDIIEATLAVEKECPVGKYFGVSDIGEGRVYSCISEGYESSDFMFKSKGNLHINNSQIFLSEDDKIEIISFMSNNNIFEATYQFF